ncbi:MAG: hypothetical protein AAGK09_05245 [Planctomycetota bacterium]
MTVLLDTPPPTTPLPPGPPPTPAPAPADDRYPAQPPAGGDRSKPPTPQSPEARPRNPFARLARWLNPPMPPDLRLANPPQTGSSLRPPHANRLIREIAERRYHLERAGRVEARTANLHPDDHETYDFLFAGPGEPHRPEAIFNRLRWGGVFCCVGDSAADLVRVAEAFANHPGFHVEQPVATAHVPVLGVRLPGLSPTGLYFAVRKTHLVMPGRLTDRFTYDVALQPPGPSATPRRRFTDTPDAGYTVVKAVPDEQALLTRLSARFPNANADDLAARAHKFVDHVFPTFLTREAAFLQILQRDLPEAYRNRVPRLLDMQKDDKGFVRRLSMNWLRTGTQPFTQLDFAHQAADLLAVIHDQAKIMHLDLRLDNFVLTDEGVGFVDFGSAVRIGEDLKQSPMLTSLFGEMMRTSQIQRMLGHMIQRGDVHNPAFTAAHHNVSPALDSYYLAVTINRPKHNPLFAHLIDHNKQSPQAKALTALTAAVLRPKATDKAEFKTAADILRGIQRIERKLGQPKPTRSAA